jgi:hypothetical protein
MPKPTKEALEAVTIPFFTSPVDGQTYSVTLAAQIAASIRDMMMSALRDVSPTEYAKVRAAEFAAIKAGDSAKLREAFVLLVETIAKLIPESGQEHPLARQARHTMTDVLEVLSPEDHAQYRAIKYTGATEGKKHPKANPEKRTEALVLAGTVYAKAALVPGF